LIKLAKAHSAAQFLVAAATVRRKRRMTKVAELLTQEATAVITAVVRFAFSDRVCSTIPLSSFPNIW
jgi:hypothetical protein